MVLLAKELLLYHFPGFCAVNYSHDVKFYKNFDYNT